MLSKSYTKNIQSLQHKKSRDETGLFLAEGPKLIPELLLSAKFICRQLLATTDWITANAALLKNLDAEIIAVKDFELEKISSLATANEVLAVFEKRKTEEIFSLHGKITLMLDGIQDPGNLGTIIRTADWYGVEHIICSPSCADVYNPKVVQSTMGSIARVNIVYTALEVWIQANRNIPLYAAALKGKKLSEFEPLKEGILIIGNDRKVSATTCLRWHQSALPFPERERAESLNAAVAAGIILSHIIKLTDDD